MIHRPQGAQCFFDGSYYKILNDVVFRFDGIEWVKSAKTLNRLKSVLRWRDPFVLESWALVKSDSYRPPVGYVHRQRTYTPRQA